MSQGICKSKKVFTLGFVNPTSLVLKIELHGKHARGTKGILGGPKESEQNLGGPKECFFILKINATKQVFTPPLCQDFENKIKFSNLFCLLF